MGAGMGLIAASAPISLSATGSATRKVAKRGTLNLSFKPYELQLRHAFNLARYSRTTTPDVQVQLEYDGIVGYGECSMPPYLGETVESVTQFLSKLDLSQFTDPFRLEDILAYVDSVAQGNRAAKAGVDIALHDLLGKIMGQPWYKIWGLNPEATPNTSFTIGIDTEEVVRQKVKEASPYKVIKVKMGLDKDQQTINIIREMMPDVPICVDVNQGWKTKEHALEMSKSVAACLWNNPSTKRGSTKLRGCANAHPCPLLPTRLFNACPTFCASRECMTASTSSS